MTNEMTKEETHHVLVKAYNELDRRGFTKHAFEERDGRVCARGAILAALDESDENLFSAIFQELPISRLVAEVNDLPKGEEEDCCALASWNNAPERTKEDVLAAFFRAIRATAPDPAEVDLEVEPELVA